MANSIANITLPPELGQAATAQASSGGVGGSKPDADATAEVQSTSPNAQANAAASAPARSADLRLEIEDDKAAGCFVYKIINRATGEVVEQIPQEQIVKLREADGYLAGDVIKAQA